MKIMLIHTLHGHTWQLDDVMPIPNQNDGIQIDGQMYVVTGSVYNLDQNEVQIFITPDSIIEVGDETSAKKLQEFIQNPTVDLMKQIIDGDGGNS